MITYQAEIWGENYRRASLVEDGFGNAIVANQGVLRARGALDIPFFGEVTSVTFKTNGIVSMTQFAYFNSFTTVTNEKGIMYNYYFNSNGDFVSVLESVGTDLRELEKRPGDDIQSRGTTGSFNGIGTHRITAGTTVVADNAANSMIILNDIQSYRERCSNFRFFTIGFWMFTTRALPMRSMVRITVNSADFPGWLRNETTENFGIIEGGTTGWQYVEVQCDIPRNTVRSFEMRFLNGLDAFNIQFAGMKIVYSEKSEMILTRSNARIDFKQINRVQFTNANTNQVETMSYIQNGFYMSETDVQMTYQSLIRTRTNPFILSTRDGRLKFAVNNVTLFNSDNVNNTFPIALISYHQANYLLESISPDADVITNTLFYRLPPDVRNNNPEGFDIIVRAQRGNRSSEERVWIDFQGRVRLEVEEYGAYTDYFYNANGTMSKEVSHPGNPNHPGVPAGERLTLSYTEDNNVESLASRTDRNTFISSDPLGELSREERLNLTSTGAIDINSAYNLSYTSNMFGDKVDVLTDNLGSRNNITYDASGRVTSIRGFGDYHYEYEYGELDNLIRCFYVSGTVRNIQTETILDRINNTITRRGFRNGGNIPSDITIINMDNFGRMTRITQNGVSTDFIRQTVSESQIVSGITSYHDNFEGRTQTFQYTQDGTEITEYQNGDQLTINASGTNRVRHNLPAFRNNRRLSETEINFDQQIFMNPRITETNDLLAAQFNFSERITYQFDGFGRTTVKNKPLNNSITRENISYHPGTFIVREIAESTGRYIASSTLGVGSRLRTSRFVNNYITGVTTRTTTYEYDSAGRLTAELLEGNRFLENGWRQYQYNLDGSIRRVTDRGIVRDYNYTNGRLSSIGNQTFSHDDLGNFTNHNGAILGYTRFNLPEHYTLNSVRTDFKYNVFGVRIQKSTAGGRTINYTYDGDKLLGEVHGDGRNIRYIYDKDEMVGFITENNIEVETCYFIKDTEGSVIGLRTRSSGFIFYEYDSWGNHRVMSVAFIGAVPQVVHDQNHIGHINPIRWKSRYFDRETGFYLVGDRYYSPMINSYITPCDLEEMVYNIHEPANFNQYTIGNPVYFPQALQNINTSIHVVFDPYIIPSGRGWLSSILMLVGLTALTIVTFGKASPFTFMKKAGIIGTMVAGTAIKTKKGKIAHGATRAIMITGVGDVTEFAITGEFRHDTWQDIVQAYGISAFTGGITGGMKDGVFRNTLNITLQPAINEFISSQQNDANFNFGNLAMNMAIRSTTLGRKDLIVPGIIRGGFRGSLVNFSNLRSLN